MASSGLDDYLCWLERIEKFRASGLKAKAFCLREGFNPRSFYRWRKKLKDGLPEQLRGEQAERDKAESGMSLFLPVAVKAEVQADAVEIDLANGSRVRLSAGVSRRVLLEVVRVVAEAQSGRARS